MLNQDGKQLPEKAEKIINGFIIIASLFAAVLRFVQMSYLTDSSTGFAVKGSEAAVGAFFVLCVFFVGLCGVRFFLSDINTNPYDLYKSKTFAAAGAFAAAAMFYDFIHQCLNSYAYIIKTSFFELNYFIPLCFSAVSALLCSFYFIILSISFNTDKYDFRNFRTFHLAPVFWLLCTLVTRLTRYDDGIYAVESILHYAVIIFGIIFFLSAARCIDGGADSLKLLCFSGVSYGLLSIILALPRIGAVILKIQVYPVTFSSLAYLLTGVFALILCVQVIKKDKSKEG